MTHQNKDQSICFILVQILLISDKNWARYDWLLYLRITCRNIGGYHGNGTIIHSFWIFSRGQKFFTFYRPLWVICHSNICPRLISKDFRTKVKWNFLKKWTKNHFLINIHEYANELINIMTHQNKDQCICSILVPSLLTYAHTWVRYDWLNNPTPYFQNIGGCHGNGSVIYSAQEFFRGDKKSWHSRDPREQFGTHEKLSCGGCTVGLIRTRPMTDPGIW